MNVCSLSRFESKCFLTPRVHSIAVALLALTEAYASAFESFKET